MLPEYNLRLQHDKINSYRFTVLDALHAALILKMLFSYCKMWGGVLLHFGRKGQP